ncbi:MAG: branched-chain amino acid ABC transporter permease [Clostridiales bacterium]|nr:branched-chain amino acid ABC transporter permease [Clostridiales bacterium]
MSENTVKIKSLPSEKKRKETDWLFGMSGKATFIAAFAAILIFCFLDAVHPGKAWIPNYVKYVAACALIYAIAGIGINFHSGYIGETSLGHAAFYGIGAYVTGFLTTRADMNFWLTIPIGMIFAAICALPVGWAGTRVRGSFMVVITYGYSEILRYIAINSLTLGGTSGISGIPTPTILGVKLTKISFLPSNKDGFILILFFIVAFLGFFTWRIVHSRVGYAFAAIREDSIAATAMGINVKGYKILALILSAVICSLAGSFYAGFSNFVAPDLLSATLSITIFTILVVGGRRTIPGAVLGAFIIVIFPELLRMVQEILHLSFDPWYILYGVLLVVIMRFKPEGIFGRKDN